jgi:ABC-type glycerol-3-phosphate transport system substrate-binding protein
MNASRRSRFLTALLVLGLAAALSGCGGGGGGGTQQATTAADNPEEGDLVYWFWAESDAPGANKWMQQMVDKYQQLHPKVHIKLVPQATDTLIGAFRTASQSKSGPDIATQWATLPTLTPAWTGAAVPISDLVAQAELANWLNTQENVYQGKVWAMPLYLLGVPFAWNKDLFRKAGLDPEHAPATWDDLMSACGKLKAAGITPIGMGNKDGYFGAWFFSLIGKQSLDSPKDLQQAMLGNAKFSDERYSGFYRAFEQLKKSGCLNDDVASLDLNQGWQLFPQRKAAMAWTTDGNVLAWEKTLGAGKIGVGNSPKLGNGKLAGTYDTTQSSDAFITSWSKHKRAAAAFLTWLHQPENLTSWYQATGVFPADKRFPASSVTDPLAKQLFALDTQPGAIWPENYLPPQVDQNADLPAGQMITSGSGSPQQAAARWDRVIQQWKTQHPDEYANYQKWTESTS